MRLVFNTLQQCAHVWAQNSQQQGRCGNIQFSNGTIYSYGYWPMATFVRNAQGEQAVLIRDESYSMSTSRHQREARSALPSYVRTITLYGDLSNNVGDWVPNESMRRDVQRMVADALGKAKRARKNTHWHLENARCYADAFNELREFFGPETVEPITWDEDADKMLSDLKAQAAAQQARDEKERAERLQRAAERREREEVEAKANLLVWKAGGRGVDSWMFRNLPCVLRIRENTIETSHGAEVPLSYARRLWALIKHCRATGEGYCPENFEVGHFRLREVTPKGTLHIGCHTIPYESTRELAVTLGYITPEEYNIEVDAEVTARLVHIATTTED